MNAYTLLTLALLLMTQACSPSQAQKRLDLKVVNLTQGEIDDVEIRFEKSTCVFGVADKGSEMTYMHYEKPIGPAATVTWRDSHSTRHKAAVDISKLDLGKSCILVFEIREGAVVVPRVEPL
jgi:hypothetical protein